LLQRVDIRSTVGQNVAKYRRLKAWSQEELAFQSGLHRTYISGVERGVRNPTILVLAQIAEALEIRPSQLLDYVVE
jgi:transcriptional regulator with XRE-family HTH domain